MSLKRIFVSLATIMFASPSLAQSVPTVDPEIAVYKQLLSGVEDSLARTVKADADTIKGLQDRISDLEKQLKTTQANPNAQP